MLLGEDLFSKVDEGEDESRQLSVGPHIAMYLGVGSEIH